jgi:hypothetical protein
VRCRVGQQGFDRLTSEELFPHSRWFLPTRPPFRIDPYRA